MVDALGRRATKSGVGFCCLPQLLVAIIREVGNIVNIWQNKTLRQNATENDGTHKSEGTLPEAALDFCQRRFCMERFSTGFYSPETTLTHFCARITVSDPTGKEGVPWQKEKWFFIRSRRATPHRRAAGGPA
ncbi:hypothetical protein, partial [uncultured Subdoligranulum sp.]|uniref:hypothetical protein n=1 Tax=uncultured Subdoligranulum sp. TaxID=512298 RepID=UPI0026210459